MILICCIKYIICLIRNKMSLFSVNKPPYKTEPILIENQRNIYEYSYGDSNTTAKERRPLAREEVWLDYNDIPDIPPSVAAYPGGATVGSVKGVSGVVLTQVLGNPLRFESISGHFHDIVPANYADGAYTPLLFDNNGAIIEYNPTAFALDGLERVLEFKDYMFVPDASRQPLHLTYWRYVGQFPCCPTSFVTGGANLGGGAVEIYENTTIPTMNFRTINAGAGIGITQTGSLITINATSSSTVPNVLDLYVSQAGNDSTGNGTNGAPYATLERAFTDIRNIGYNDTATVTVLSAGGTLLVPAATVMSLKQGNKGLRKNKVVVIGSNVTTHNTGLVVSSQSLTASSELQIINVSPAPTPAFAVGRLVTFTAGNLSNIAPPGGAYPTGAVSAWIASVISTTSIALAYGDGAPTITTSTFSVTEPLATISFGGNVTIEGDDQDIIFKNLIFTNSAITNVTWDRVIATFDRTKITTGTTGTTFNMNWYGSYNSAFYFGRNLTVRRAAGYPNFIYAGAFINNTNGSSILTLNDAKMSMYGVGIFGKLTTNNLIIDGEFEDLRYVYSTYCATIRSTGSRIRSVHKYNCVNSYATTSAFALEFVRSLIDAFGYVFIASANNGGISMIDTYATGLPSQLTWAHGNCGYYGLYLNNSTLNFVRQTMTNYTNVALYLENNSLLREVGTSGYGLNIQYGGNGGIAAVFLDTGSMIKTAGTTTFYINLSQSTGVLLRGASSIVTTSLSISNSSLYGIIIEGGSNVMIDTISVSGSNSDCILIDGGSINRNVSQSGIISGSTVGSYNSYSGRNITMHSGNINVDNIIAHNSYIGGLYAARNSLINCINFDSVAYFDPDNAIYSFEPGLWLEGSTLYFTHFATLSNYHVAPAIHLTAGSNLNGASFSNIIGHGSVVNITGGDCGIIMDSSKMVIDAQIYIYNMYPQYGHAFNGHGIVMYNSEIICRSRDDGGSYGGRIEMSYITSRGIYMRTSKIGVHSIFCTEINETIYASEHSVIDIAYQVDSTINATGTFIALYEDSTAYIPYAHVDATNSDGISCTNSVYYGNSINIDQSSSSAIRLNASKMALGGSLYMANSASYGIYMDNGSDFSGQYIQSSAASSYGVICYYSKFWGSSVSLYDSGSYGFYAVGADITISGLNTYSYNYSDHILFDSGTIFNISSISCNYGYERALVILSGSTGYISSISIDSSFRNGLYIDYGVDLMVYSLTSNAYDTPVHCRMSKLTASSIYTSSNQAYQYNGAINITDGSEVRSDNVTVSYSNGSGVRIANGSKAYLNNISGSSISGYGVEVRHGSSLVYNNSGASSPITGSSGDCYVGGLGNMSWGSLDTNYGPGINNDFSNSSNSESVFVTWHP